MFCPNCGKEVEEDFNLCPNCGTRLKDVPAGGKVSKSVQDKGFLIGLIGGAAAFVSCFLPTLTMTSGGELYNLTVLFAEDFGFLSVISLICVAVATLVHVTRIRFLSVIFAIVNLIYAVAFAVLILYSLSLTGGFIPSIGLLGYFAGSVALLVGAFLLKKKK